MPVVLDVVAPDMVMPHVMVPARMMPMPTTAAAFHLDDRLAEVIRIALRSPADGRYRARRRRKQQRAGGKRRDDDCSHGVFSP